MENEQKKLVLLASEVMISEEEQKLNPVFLSIRLKLADNVGNRNDEGVTAAFISDLIKRQEEFECLPFYADVKNLLARNYDSLGHMYNRVTRKFSSTQIGSLTDFYSETDNNGVISLYATARVPKRENEICERLAELYGLGKLNVSFEIRYNPEHTVEKDGIVFIDAHEDNALTGLALVSVPAVVDATALDMVASVADDSDEIVAESEEQAERGEQNKMPNEEKMTAEVEETMVSEAETDQEENPISVAEGEGASESAGEGASESGGEGASEGGGSGASEGGGEGGGGSDEDETDALTIDHEDENKANAEAQDANAEIVDHSVETYEAVEKCPETGETMHVQVVTERLVEIIDPETVIAEQKDLIAELESKIAELEKIKEQYDMIVAEREAKELADKKAKAKAFAEKQGLNVEDTAVAEAIEALDYTKIAELSMAEEQEENDEEPAKPTITLASFVEMEISDDKYGGLLSRKNK